VLYLKALSGRELTPTSVSNWLIGQLKKADKFRTTKPRAEKSRLENEGRSFGTMEQTSNGVKIFLDAKKEPAFAQFVADKMTV
jgi:hypothetical protein